MLPTNPSFREALKSGELIPVSRREFCRRNNKRIRLGKGKSRLAIHDMDTDMWGALPSLALLATGQASSSVDFRERNTRNPECRLSGIWPLHYMQPIGGRSDKSAGVGAYEQ